jgi:polysaccharide pyruvyl transferase CsaB
MKRVVICGYYGMGNGGDEALLATLLQMLPRSVKPIVLSQTPVATAQHYQVESLDRWNLGAIFQAMRRADAFIWGGGSLVQDVSSQISPLYYLGLMKMAQIMGLRTIAWAQGIGPLGGKFNRAFSQNVLNRCLAVSVRDRVSSDLLTSWGIANTLAPDPVWAMETGQMNPHRDRPAAPVIAVNLRQHQSLTPARLELLTTALIQLQQRTEASILLVPFQASLDLALAQDLQQRLGAVSQVIQLEDPAELRHLFDRVDVAIVMRLHALIMSAAAGCECFALSYDPKVTQVATSLHLPVWEMASLSEDREYLVSTWETLFAPESPHHLSPEQRQTLSQNARQHQMVLNQLI